MKKRKIDCKSTLDRLAQDDVRFAEPKEKINKRESILFRVYINTLAKFAGKRISIRFIPRKGEFDKLNERVSKVGAKIEARIEAESSDKAAYLNTFDLFDIWGDGMAFALPSILNNLRSSLFKSLKGNAQISLCGRGGGIIFSGNLLYHQYESIAKSLIKLKAVGPKKKSRKSTKRNKGAQIYFHMRGTVPQDTKDLCKISDT